MYCRNGSKTVGVVREDFKKLVMPTFFLD